MTTFKWWGEQLELLDHPYNTTALNERAVEVPIAAAWIARRHGSGLEVGNVLAHYMPISHDVVDLHEHAPGVRNVDVFDLHDRYDWIVTISTVEHIRWDHGDREPDAAARAIRHLRSLLNPGGRMLVTVPLGYHPPLDDEILGGGLDVERACTLVRGKAGWRQTKTPTRRPYIGNGHGAGAVWIGELVQEA